jgi:hypothetical protein
VGGGGGEGHTDADGIGIGTGTRLELTRRREAIEALMSDGHLFSTIDDLVS